MAMESIAFFGVILDRSLFLSFFLNLIGLYARTRIIMISKSEINIEAKILHRGVLFFFSSENRELLTRYLERDNISI